MQQVTQPRAAAAESQTEILTRKADYAQSWCATSLHQPPGAPARRPSLPATDSFERAHGCRCNPSGAVLTPVADNVWGAERPFTWNRIDVGGRGAVIRLSDGTIWTQASKGGGSSAFLW